jgi:hypothetical protein
MITPLQAHGWQPVGGYDGSCMKPATARTMKVLALPLVFALVVAFVVLSWERHSSGPERATNLYNVCAPAFGLRPVQPQCLNSLKQISITFYPHPAALSGVEAKGSSSTDWPMFGGSPSRNMVNLTAKNVPTDWSVEEGKLKNVKWMATLGSYTNGGPIVADGKVYVGTNNANPRDPKTKGYRAVLMCFNQADG